MKVREIAFIAGLALLAPVSHAQAQPTAADASEASGKTVVDDEINRPKEGEDSDSPVALSRVPLRDFKLFVPSEEVSVDRPVDFPSDI